MLRNVLLVGLGSMAGGIGRYMISLAIAQRYISTFPYGTFLVNVLGCFAVGCFYGLGERYEWFSPELRLMLAVGLCGGFTTFSSFAYENVGLLQSRDHLTFAAYVLLSVAVGLAAAGAGLWLARP